MRILQKSLDCGLKQHKLEVAIDFHDQPYYGKTGQAEGLWVGAEAKQGTTKVYRVATAYVIKNGHRLTLAIKFVLPEESIKEVLEYLLKQLKRLEIQVGCLYLDRGFGSIEVAKYLQSIKQTAIVASPIRGKTGGLKALCAGKKSYRTRHVFKSLKHGAQARRNGDVQGLYDHHEKRRKKAQSQMAGIYVD